MLAGVVGVSSTTAGTAHGVGARLIDETQSRCSGLTLDVTPSVVGTPVVVRVEINGNVTLLAVDDEVTRHFPFDAPINSWSYTVREAGMIRPFEQSGTTASCAMASANAAVVSGTSDVEVGISAVTPVPPASPTS